MGEGSAREEPIATVIAGRSPGRRSRPATRRWCMVALAALAATAIAGCHPARPTTVPMQVLTLRPGTAATRCAVVFLEGRFDRPQSFARAGFDRALAAAGVDAEIVAPDSHVGYFLQDSLVQRLAADVVGPLRARGHERVWLVGISMGGTGALAYAQRHPDEVVGVCVLAPYLGDPELISELAAVGGLAPWRPSPTMAPDDHLRHLWVGLQRRTAPGASGPPIYLGYGTQDPLAPGARVLAAALPPGRVFTVAGGHRWSAWRRLWNAFLTTGALRDTCR